MSVEFVKPVVQKQKMRGQPGRLRAGHLLTLLSIASPTLYKRINSGEVPKPDGHDGRPYWNTQTVRKFLAGAGAINCAGGKS